MSLHNEPTYARADPFYQLSLKINFFEYIEYSERIKFNEIFNMKANKSVLI